MPRSKIRTHLARLVRTAAYVLAFLAPPVIAAVVCVSSTISGAYEPAAASVASPTASLPVAAHDPAKPTAVVVLSNAGSQVTDVLAPYEVLATTKEFNVYAAAPVKQPVPLAGGLDLMPQLTLDELDQRMNGRSPEVIVVPAMPGARRDGALGQGLLGDWLKRHISGAGTVLSVCNGAEVLGEAGLLDGRRVTANWAGIDAFRKRYPNAQWMRGLRYVEDGNLISTAGITSGVNGALRVVAKHLGEDAGRDLALRIGYPDQRFGHLA